MKSKHSMPTAVFSAGTEGSAFAIGRIVHLQDGRPFVDYVGNPGVPRQARVAAVPPADFDYETPDRLAVLLLIDDRQSEQPIIVGFLSDCLTASRREPVAQAPRDVLLDGRRVVLTASQEILLRCGKGSIYLGKDGKIVIRGLNIISRSSGTNKVKGAAVKIN